MLKYWIKNRLLITFTKNLIFIFIISFIFFMPSLLNYANSNKELSLYNGSYIDFDVPSPSKQQVEDLENLDHIQFVIPYIYTNKSIKLKSQNIVNDVGILFFRDFTDIEKTMYNRTRIIESNENYSNNSLLVDYNLVSQNLVKLGDLVEIDFNGKLIEFTVDGIYETNIYYNSFVVAGVWSGEQRRLTESSLNRELNYSGAYISSNNLVATDLYLKNEYKPYARLRERLEFDNDESYLIHYNAFISGNYSNEISDFNILKNVAISKSNDYLQIARLNLISGLLLLLFYMVISNFALLFRKSEYRYFNARKVIGASSNSYYFYTMIAEIMISSFIIVILTLINFNNLPLFLPINIFYNILLFNFSILFVAVSINYFTSIYLVNND